MVDKYDAAVAKVEALKREYAEHKEHQRIRRKPLMLVLCGMCVLMIAWLVASAGGTGIGLFLALVACACFVMAYRQWGQRT